MHFTCIGFDVRQWPWKGPFNTDETGWEINEDRYTEVKEKFDLQENEYQLLAIQEQKLLTEVIKFTQEIDDCNLMAIEFPSSVVKIHDSKHGFKTAQTQMDLPGFVYRGFDVCDFNGLFSILHMRCPHFCIESSELLSKDSLVTALELAQIANVLVPNHSPFVVAAVYTLK